MKNKQTSASTQIKPKKFIMMGCVVMLGFSLWVFDSGILSEAPSFERTKMVIARADGKQLPFNAELAITPQQKEYGLMFRHSMADDAAMLFLWEHDQPVSFWMKNTYIPLDMLYVRGDGVIAKIITHAEPLNLRPLPSDQPVRAVIELKDGAVERLGLKTGDKVLYSAFSGEKTHVQQ